MYSIRDVIGLFIIALGVICALWALKDRLILIIFILIGLYVVDWESDDWGSF